MDQLDESVLNLDKLFTQINDVRDILDEISGAYDESNQSRVNLRLKVSVFLDELIADYMTEVNKARTQIVENEKKIAKLKLKIDANSA